MFVKRAAELKLLEVQYASSGNNLIVLYGRKGIGKTTLLAEFLEGKPAACYYEGSECEDRLQLLSLHRLLSDTEQEIYEGLSYPQLFSDFIGMREEKTIIILDEFHYILKNSPDIIDALWLIGNPSRPVMIILCSSSIRWVENEMIDSFGAYAAYITAYMKLKEFTFVDFVNRFPKSTVETCIYVKAILGGVPQYLEDWQESKPVSDNIKNLMLNKNSRLFEETQQFLKLELREPAVYNTILYTLATGNRKLNDLHARTGYSRAKISVYLKHLTQLDLVEKLVPLNEEGKENAQKGLYRIKDNFFSFWYRFVFPNLSELMLGKATNVYNEKIAPHLTDYMGEHYADVCTEFLKLMNQHQRLEEKFLYWDRWYGKNGTLDILAHGENNKNLVGKCFWSVKPTELIDYENLLTLAKEAGVNPDYCYLFAKNGFTAELREHAAKQKQIVLVGLEDL